MDAGILQAAAAALAGGHRVFLVTVTAATGSTPQRPGAWMAVDETGLLTGTIGGGALEYACLRLAAEGQAVPGVRHFSLNAREAGAVGMICGGSTDILFTPLADAAPVQAALAALDARQDVVFCLPLDGSAPCLAPRDPARTGPALIMDAPARMELPVLDTRRVFVIGGGHVAWEVSRLLGQLGTRHYLADDRAEFSAPERFPAAEGVFQAEFAALGTVFAGALAPTASDAVCIMTRGHEGDAAAVRWALGTDAGYIGLMGSRRKREKLFADLATAGYTGAEQRITTPIGLAIGAVTPAEIAVSVCAQLIQWFHSKGGTALHGGA